jgi:hypothetical protein
MSVKAALLMLALILALQTTGCATTTTQPVPSSEYTGPIQEPKKKSWWWSVLGAIVTPFGKFLASENPK